MIRSSRKSFSLVAVAVMAAGAFGCSDRIVGSDPVAAERAEARVLASSAPLVASQKVSVLQRNSPLPLTVSASFVVGPAGGTYRLVGGSDLGLTIAFPQNAVRQNTRITVRARPGNLVAYEFEPHGITFDAPVVLQQSLSGTVAFRNDAVMSGLAGGYSTTDVYREVAETGSATVEEEFPITIDPARQTARFEIRHFSIYLVSVGRNSTE